MPAHQDFEFSNAELARYDRHIILPQFGLAAQQKLKAARVLVVGSGGLGSPLLLYLAAAGVGAIGIVDFDVVNDSNLQRQVLFGKNDIGAAKVLAAKSRLESLNPYIGIRVHQAQIRSENALDIIRDYDVVADGSDNFPTRYLVNDACVLSGKPLVFAAVSQFEGQVSVFNLLQDNGERGPNYRDLHPEPPAPGLVSRSSRFAWVEGTQDARAARTGNRRQIAGQPGHPAMSEPRESHRLDRLGRSAQCAGVID